jgi:hypothetical protein
MPSKYTKFFFQCIVNMWLYFAGFLVCTTTLPSLPAYSLHIYTWIASSWDGFVSYPMFVARMPNMKVDIHEWLQMASIYKFEPHTHDAQPPPRGTRGWKPRLCRKPIPPFQSEIGPEPQVDVCPCLWKVEYVNGGHSYHTLAIDFQLVVLLLLHSLC